VPFDHWTATTFEAGPRRSGMVAPWVLDGPMNADAFLTYVTRILVPELGRGDVVTMDNLSSHKAPAVPRYGTSGRSISLSRPGAWYTRWVALM
jgi:hypothetical protein